MKRIFVINGEAGCGKDTFVELCDSHSTLLIENISMVDKVKAIAKECGWSGEKTPEARKFLSDLKDLCDNFNNMSYQDVKSSTETFLNDPFDDILFIHAREPEDIKRLCDEFDAKSILIKRKGYKTKASNHADENVYNFDYDYVIENPGTNLSDYAEVAIRFLKNLDMEEKEYAS